MCRKEYSIMFVVLFFVLIPIFLLSVYLCADTTIPGGPVSGIWELTGSPFYIEGEINIPIGETLNIEPGVMVEFQGHYKFLIYGYLEAVGTEADSIIFTAADPETGWHSLRFIDAPDSSHLSYCIIQYGRATGEIPDSYGGGIYCANSNPVITYCTIIGNFAENHCGGIGCSNSNPEIRECMISGNTAAVSGGGIGCEYSNPQIINCIINNNSSLGPLGSGGGGIVCNDNSEPIISNCTIRENFARTGGGIACAYGSNSIIEYCDISGNSALFGGGIFVAHYADPIIRRCMITGNSAAPYDGGGVEIAYDSSPLLENCTISGNDAVSEGSQIAFWEEDSVDVKNNIIEGNSSNELVSFYDSSSLQGLTYCDFYNSGTGGSFGGTVPVGLGEITGTNANGDPCDIFMNIFLDPLFVDPANGNYHLTENSPCIDAGDPESPLDPDGTIIDIGRFYYNQTGINDNTIVQTKNYLHQNYPNPFNPTTTINYSLKKNSKVSLNIYNIKGQKVKQLVNDQLSSGKHSVVWNGKDSSGKSVSGGIYFYKLKVGDYQKVRKILLMK